MKPIRVRYARIAVVLSSADEVGTVETGVLMGEKINVRRGVAGNEVQRRQRDHLTKWVPLNY